MCKELINLINDNSLTVERFFTMDPFTYISDSLYSKIGKEINFFDDMYVISNKTYERLAVMSKLAIDDSLKALIITGYSGSGKTNFLRYCKEIIEGKTQPPQYDDAEKEMETIFRMSDKPIEYFDELTDSKIVNELQKIKDDFESSIGKIKTILNQNYFSSDSLEIRNTISNYINKSLKGKVIYFDFDENKQDHSTPLEIKLTRQIENHLSLLSENLLDAVCNFYFSHKECFKNAFVGRSNFQFDRALKTICENKNKKLEEYINKLSNCLQALEIDQLMCIEVLLCIAENINSHSNNIYYFIDNIDMISGEDNKVLITSITSFWNFIQEMGSLVKNIREKDMATDLPWIECYEKFKYVFSMRETTAMHIGDHLRSRILEFSKHFDLSLDINKSFVFKKRFDLLKKYIDEGKITNTAFVQMAECIETIAEDKYYKWNFFTLFNNDYRKAIRCLCEISSINTSFIYSCLPLVKANESYVKYGGRGIVIKVLCDSFKKWRYFNTLRVPMRGLYTKNSPYNITLVRIILTVLENLQNELYIPENSTFFVNREKCISLKELYEKVSPFCSKATFVQCVENMFYGRVWQYWNHLITFDNIIKCTRGELMNSLSEDDNNEDIYIRCTEAGERYLNYLCVHYEFFACRYSSQRSSGLFNQKQSKVKGKYFFEKQITQVLNSVKSCCKELQEVNSKLLEFCEADEYDDLLDTCYLKNNLFHEERIIHTHITYLDSYRLFLINGSLKDDKVNVNKRLIEYIREYMDLLKYNEKDFYSDNSEQLYEELSACIEAIVRTGYEDNTIVISRTYYKENLEMK